MEYKNNMPIYLQVIDDIKRRIFVGELETGSKLPSNTDLALMYKINPNTVHRIYKELELQGICYVKRGIGTFISDDANLPDKLKREIVCGTVKKFMEKMHSYGYSIGDTIEILRSLKGDDDLC